MDKVKIVLAVARKHHFWILSGVVTTARFRYAVSPFMFLLAAYGIERTVRLWKTRRVPQPLPVVL